MRQYSKTSSGAYMTVIQGEALGDGIPRAKLTLVTDSNVHLFQPPEPSQFDMASVVIDTMGYDSKPCIIFVCKFDAKVLKKHGVGGYVVDVSNWIYRRFGVGVSNPSIDGLRDRASKGYKVLAFHYEIDMDIAKRLGWTGRYGERLILKRFA